uniref:Uncharacterized protein n=1 Tax=Rhizophora mucronata TaxID=61149 RepID=A0A2P2QSW2_RHIMU
MRKLASFSSILLLIVYCLRVMPAVSLAFSSNRLLGLYLLIIRSV